MTLPGSTAVRIRPLIELDEMDACTELQREVWGRDAEVDARALLVVASRFIGQLLGAFAGDSLVGMALAFHMAARDRMHSHRVCVLPAWQLRGLGLQLKRAQREAALARGVTTIEWTFDPLQARNAAFNLNSLGGIARILLPNLYGVTASPLHGGLPTDRLLVEWELNSPRVVAALEGRRPQPGPECRRVPVPAPSVQAQADFRGRLEAMLAQGYAVTGFANETGEYLLEKL